MNIPIDFRIVNSGSIILFTPLTQKAKNFCGTDLQLEPWQWLGDSFGVDACLADDLIRSLQDEGFYF